MREKGDFLCCRLYTAQNIWFDIHRTIHMCNTVQYLHTAHTHTHMYKHVMFPFAIFKMGDCICKHRFSIQCHWCRECVPVILTGSGRKVSVEEGTG